MLALRGAFVAALAAGLVFGSGAGVGSIGAQAPDCVAQPVPASQGTFQIGGHGNLLAYGDGSVWALTEPQTRGGSASAPSVELRRVDPVRRTVTKVMTIRARGDARFAVSGGHAWISDPDSGRLLRVTLSDRRTSSVRPFGADGEPTALTLSAGRLWVIANDKAELVALDPKTLAVRRRISLRGEGLADIEVAFGAIWVSEVGGGRVVRIDPRSGAVTGRVAIPSQAGELASTAGRLWADLPERDAVVRIDPRGPALLSGETQYSGDAFAIAGGFGSLWLTNYGLGKVTRIAGRTGRVLAVLPVGRDPKGIVAGAGSVWTMNAGSCSITRISPYL